MVDLSFMEAEMLAFYAKQVERGDVFAVRVLAAAASRCLRKSNSLSEPLGSWLVKALQSIADGSGADKAFGITRRRGPPKFKIDLDQIALARDVEALRRIGRPLKSSRSNTGAFAEVAKRMNKSESTVERAYLTWRDGVRAED